MITVTLYTSAGCELCAEARTALASLQGQFPHKLVEVDISAEPLLVERYGQKIPVVKAGPYTLEAPFSLTDLSVTLASAASSSRSNAKQSRLGHRQSIDINRLVLAFARHWLAVVNLLVFMYVGLPFAAPVLMEAGATAPAQVIYHIYSPLCHQLAFRSFFLFGPQIAYPRAIAGTGMVSYEAATGLDSNDLWAARAFVGNPQVGYKVAFCERDVAIYGGMLMAGLLFGLVRKWLPPLPITLWFILGILPIAIDGGSQFLSVLPLLHFPFRESTPLLRVLTGSLFGIMNVWLAYPYVEETMAETRTLIQAKLQAVSTPVPAGD
jgi:uncharacterized membrane protein